MNTTVEHARNQLSKEAHKDNVPLLTSLNASAQKNQSLNGKRNNRGVWIPKTESLRVTLPVADKPNDVAVWSLSPQKPIGVIEGDLRSGKTCAAIQLAERIMIKGHTVHYLSTRCSQDRKLFESTMMKFPDTFNLSHISEMNPIDESLLSPKDVIVLDEATFTHTSSRRMRELIQLIERCNLYAILVVNDIVNKPYLCQLLMKLSCILFGRAKQKTNVGLMSIFEFAGEKLAELYSQSDLGPAVHGKNNNFLLLQDVNDGYESESNLVTFPPIDPERDIS